MCKTAHCKVAEEPATFLPSTLRQTFPQAVVVPLHNCFPLPFCLQKVVAPHGFEPKPRHSVSLSPNRPVPVSHSFHAYSNRRTLNG